MTLHVSRSFGVKERDLQRGSMRRDCAAQENSNDDFSTALMARISPGLYRTFTDTIETQLLPLSDNMGASNLLVSRAKAPDFDAPQDLTEK